MQTQRMSAFWLSCASLALSLAWLVPNHSIPWVGFHGDAWTAAVLSIVAAYLLTFAKSRVQWHWPACIAAVMICIPLGQYATGMTALFGVAWINSAYLLGLLLALLVGAAWENEAAGQCGDFLFLAIGLASVISVGLQLLQLLGQEPIGPWTLYSPYSRYFANMAQPNLLASLLLLGVLGCAWGFSRKHLGPLIATITAAFLLFGVALADSRTAWLNVALLVGASLIWRRLLPSKTFLRVVLGLAAFFVVCLIVMPSIIHLAGDQLVRDRATLADTRWAAWSMFSKASMHRPLLGYGWGQLATAQFLMLDERIVLGGSFLQAHNLVIDLILWNGVPMGLLITALLAWWGWRALHRIETFAQLILMSFMAVLITHAMLEYPLQYAYFLLPAGMVMGCLNVSLGFKPLYWSNRWLTAAVLAVSLSALVVTVRDYFRVETSFYGLRFELKNIETTIPRAPPDVLVLTQWRDYILLSRIEPQSGLTAAHLDWMRDVVTSMPSAYGMYRLAGMLAFNNQPAEAQVWLRRICQVTPAEQCTAIQVEWARQSNIDSRFAAIPWPVPSN